MGEKNGEQRMLEESLGGIKKTEKVVGKEEVGKGQICTSSLKLGERNGGKGSWERVIEEHSKLKKSHLGKEEAGKQKVEREPLKRKLEESNEGKEEIERKKEEESAGGKRKQSWNNL